ncbi:GDSL-type esterase/lipase family protein [Kribbella shirazensis]|uniref:Lysophospholipase L1-like esterase n=1 Tax=Kribbella shirazensis TaxID=1105143 RepID=A0A7X5V4Y1_9ACTN|nr:GDSL-type esterase/lipase family protein [Kribbella shirazensis]NIK54701.1 lysophospholipase L1-like esterase [Kribbella shirazensis]
MSRTTAAQDLGPGTRPDLWSGAVAWTGRDQRWQPWRLFPDEERFAYTEGLSEQARVAAGVRLAAVIRGGVLELEVEAVGNNSAPVDVLADGKLIARHPVAGRSKVRVELPDHQAEVEVWLPQQGRTIVTAVRAVGSEQVARRPPGERRWVAYGSSITQCVESDGPSETWPALVARELGWDLTCLGFGGNCQLDPVVPRTIARLDVDVVSLCLGINIYGAGTFNARSLPGQLAELVRRVREAHPAAGIVVGSPVICPRRETTPNEVGLTLRAIRELVHTVGLDFRARGDDRVHVLDGLSLLGEHDADLLHDGLHPGPDGYRLMAARTVRYLRETGLAAPTLV